MNNCILIGLEAGIEITDRNNVVIIGDGIKNIPEGYKIAIGQNVFGERCNLIGILRERASSEKDGVLILNRK